MYIYIYDVCMSRTFAGRRRAVLRRRPLRPAQGRGREYSIVEYSIED